MTKPKRVTLLLTDIFLLLAGIGALLVFLATTHLVSRTPGWPYIPSPQEVNKITNVATLQSRANDAYEKLDIFLQVVDSYRWFFLVFGCFLAIGSIVHFALTPWRLTAKSNDPS